VDAEYSTTNTFPLAHTSFVTISGCYFNPAMAKLKSRTSSQAQTYRPSKSDSTVDEKYNTEQYVKTSANGQLCK